MFIKKISSKINSYIKQKILLWLLPRLSLSPIGPVQSMDQHPLYFFDDMNKAWAIEKIDGSKITIFHKYWKGVECKGDLYLVKNSKIVEIDEIAQQKIHFNYMVSGVKFHRVGVCRFLIRYNILPIIDHILIFINLFQLEKKLKDHFDLLNIIQEKQFNGYGAVSCNDVFSMMCPAKFFSKEEIINHIKLENLRSKIKICAEFCVNAGFLEIYDPQNPRFFGTIDSTSELQAAFAAFDAFHNRNKPEQFKPWGFFTQMSITAQGWICLNQHNENESSRKSNACLQWLIAVFTLVTALATIV